MQRLILAATLLIAFFGQANADSAEAIERIQEFYEASLSFQASLFAGTSAIEDVVDGSVNPESFRATADHLVSAHETWLDKKDALSDLLNDPDYADRNEFDAIRRDIEDPGHRNIEALITALGEFASTIESDTYTVYANEDWANTGISVGPGDLIVVSADGQWSISPNYGNADHRGYVCEGSTAYRVSDEAHLGALIFRVRGSTKQSGYPLSEDGKGIADARGRLEFAINDSDRRNNSGQLHLSISVFDADATKALQKAYEDLQSSPST